MLQNQRFHEFMAVVLKMGEEFHPDLDDLNSNILIQYFHATVNALLESENAGKPVSEHITYQEIYQAKKQALKNHFVPNIHFYDLPPIEKLNSKSAANNIYNDTLRNLYPNGYPEAFSWDNLPD